MSITVTRETAIPPMARVEVHCAEVPPDYLAAKPSIPSTGKIWICAHKGGDVAAICLTHADAIAFAEALIEMANQ